MVDIKTVNSKSPEGKKILKQVDKELREVEQELRNRGATTFEGAVLVGDNAKGLKVDD